MGTHWSQCFAPFTTSLSLPFLVPGHAHTVLASFDCCIVSFLGKAWPSCLPHGCNITDPPAYSPVLLLGDKDRASNVQEQREKQRKEMRGPNTTASATPRVRCITGAKIGTASRQEQRKLPVRDFGVPPVQPVPTSNRYVLVQPVNVPALLQKTQAPPARWYRTGLAWALCGSNRPGLCWVCSSTAEGCPGIVCLLARHRGRGRPQDSARALIQQLSGSSLGLAPGLAAEVLHKEQGVLGLPLGLSGRSPVQSFTVSAPGLAECSPELCTEPCNNQQD